MVFLLREKVTTLPGGIKAFCPKARKKGEKAEKSRKKGLNSDLDETVGWILRAFFELFIHDILKFFVKMQKLFVAFYEIVKDFLGFRL